MPCLWQRIIHEGEGELEPILLAGYCSEVVSTLPASIEWSRLTPRGQAILRRIAIPISLGFSEREMARQLGTRKRWVSDRLDELRAELERLSG